MANFVNPLSAVAGFKNQQLAPVFNNRGGVGAALPQKEDLGIQGPNLDSLGTIKDRATRQHNLYLNALQAQQKRNEIQAKPSVSGGGYRYNNRGGSGAGQGFVGRYNLIAGADRALSAMNAAYRQQFGRDLIVNSGGRTYAEQAAAYARYKAGRGNLAARPGTSVHEFGRAVDFGGPIQNANSREHRWLQQNAHVWGFKWTGKNFSQFEPWHWEWHG